MRSLISTYAHVFGMGLQNGLVYRWNFAGRVTFSFLHFAFVLVFWRAAFSSKAEIGGFTFAETMTYFLTVVVVNYLISAFNEDYQISEEIRNGTINQFLTKPIDYYLYRVVLFFANRFVTGSVVMVPLILLLPLVAAYLPDGLSLVQGLAAVPAIFFAAIIQFSIAFCFGLLAFWFLDIQGFVILSFAVETLLSGQVFPLDLLPAPLFAISSWLPFHYQMYFPVAVISGRITAPHEIVSGLLVQLTWVVLFLLLGRLLWHIGLRKHTAVGG